MEIKHGGKRDNRKKKDDDRRGGRRVPGPGKKLGRPPMYTIDEIRIVPAPTGIVVEQYENGVVVKSQHHTDHGKAEAAAHKAGVKQGAPVEDWTKESDI